MDPVTEEIDKLEQVEVETVKRYGGFTLIFGISLTFVAVALIVIGILVLPPTDFPEGKMIEIADGATLREIGTQLKQEGLIRSETLFVLSVRAVAGDSGALAGDYFFETPRGVVSMARAVSTGDFGLTPTSVRVVEGSTLEEIAALFTKDFPRFDPVEFLALTEELEGKLFPDTYQFLENVRAPEVVSTLHENYTAKIAELSEVFAASTLSEDEVITLASIIEKEAWKSVDRRLISGVLHNRLNINMPLQVDAVFIYFMGKNTFQLTLEDLKVDSPYNTYTNRGLPPGPIGSPSLDSIMAALVPEPSDYLYYLADMEGTTHYATNFEDHKRNKFKYLR